MLKSIPLCTCDSDYYGIQCSFTPQIVDIKINEIVRNIYISTGDDLIESITDTRDFVQLRSLSTCLIQNKDFITKFKDMKNIIIDKTSKY